MSSVSLSFRSFSLPLSSFIAPLSGVVDIYIYTHFSIEFHSMVARDGTGDGFVDSSIG